MIKFKSDEKGFASLIGMVVALALICFFVYYMMNTYFKAQVSLPESVGINSSSGNSVTNYQSIVTNTRNKVEEINKKSMDALKQAEEAYK
jgi:hypothetical protein